jgi:hypothetical protein
MILRAAFIDGGAAPDTLCALAGVILGPVRNTAMDGAAGWIRRSYISRFSLMSIPQCRFPLKLPNVRDKPAFWPRVDGANLMHQNGELTSCWKVMISSIPIAFFFHLARTSTLFG